MKFKNTTNFLQLLNRSFILLLVINFFTIYSLIAATSNPPPNILLFLADDMTWRDCEPYGNKDVITPNISKLADEGMSFDNMFTSTAMCAPTRQQLYTGIYPVRNGAYPNHSNVHFGVKSLAHHFSTIGYRTALIGKTHYGPVESFPFEFLGGRHHDNGDGIDIHLDRMEPIIDQDKHPFFLVVASNQPHKPWTRGRTDVYDEDKFTVPEYLIDNETTRSELKKYYAEITYTDSLLGECMKYIESAGKTDNTIVIFTSEQGSQFPFAKWTCYDLGLKTAFIVKWPGKVKPGARNNALTQYVDVIPTLLESVNIDPNTINTGIADHKGDQSFDGVSFLNVLLGNTSEHREYVYGVQTTRGIFSGSICYPIRSIRTKDYKYIINLNGSSPFFNLVNTRENGLYASWIETTNDNIAKQDYVRRYIYRSKEELYHISKDPYELNNLADNPKLNPIKVTLIKELSQWMHHQGDKGIDTEMNALNRQYRWNEEKWKGYEELQNDRILNLLEGR